MSSDIIGQKMKKKYSSVDQHIRDEILDLFFAKKYSCSEISSLTGVNRSTVKAICRIYKIEGRRQKLNKHEKKTKQCINSYVCIYDEETKSIKFLNRSTIECEIKGQEQHTLNDQFLNNLLDSSYSLVSNQLNVQEARNEFIKNISQCIYQDFNPQRKRMKINPEVVKDALQLKSDIIQF